MPANVLLYKKFHVGDIHPKWWQRILLHFAQERRWPNDNIRYKTIFGVVFLLEDA